MTRVLNSLAEQLGVSCRNTDHKIVTAESCTGGGLAEAITRIPGSSNWFERGFITYSDVSKQEQLDVSEQLINHHGAVSEATALAMARGALGHSHADFAVSITGIAGPSGDNEEKPVGMVCFAWTGKQPQSTRTATVRFEGNRCEVRTQACIFALRGLIEELGKNPV